MVRVRFTGALVAAFALLLAAPALGQEDPARAAAYHFAVAKMLAAEGAYQDALAAIEEAVRLRPDDTYLRLEEAELLLRLAERSADPAARAARLGAAAAAVRAAERVEPENTDLLRLKSRVWLALADGDPQAFDETLRALELLRARQPGDVQSMLGLGRLYLSRGRAAEAAAVFQEIIQHRPDVRIAHSLLADALRRDRRPQEAEEALRALLSRDPAALDSRLELADLLSQRGDHGAAVELLRAAPPEARGNPAVQRRLAFELYRLGDLAGALAAIEPVIAADRDDLGGRYLRALIFAAEARSAEAGEELEALHVTAPASAEIALALARVRERQGRPTEAARAIRETVERLEAERRPREAALMRLELGGSLARAERWAEAEQALAPLLADQDAAVRSDGVVASAAAMHEQGRSGDALALLAAHESGDLASRAKRAEILHRQGKAGEARALLEELAQRGPGGSVLAADVYQRLESYDESIALLEGVLDRGAGLGGSPLPSRRGLRAHRAARRRHRRFSRAARGSAPDFAPALELPGLHARRAGREPRRSGPADPARGGPRPRQRRLRRFPGLGPLPARRARRGAAATSSAPPAWSRTTPRCTSTWATSTRALGDVAERAQHLPARPRARADDAAAGRDEAARSARRLVSARPSGRRGRRSGRGRSAALGCAARAGSLPRRR